MKRVRPSFTCLRCKERKVKCNKQLPCDSCVRNGQPQLCKFEDNSHVKAKENTYVQVYEIPLKSRETKSKRVSKEEKTLNNTNTGTIASEDEEIDIYKKNTPAVDNELRESNTRPLTWSFIERKEPALNMLLRYIRSLSSRGDVDLSTPQLLEEDRGEKTSPLVRSFDTDTLEKLLSSITSIFESKDAINAIIPVFFEHFYVFMPVIDEKSFTSEINRIVNTRDDDMSLVFRIEKNDDLAIIGTLLIISRMCHLLQSVSDKWVLPTNIQIHGNAIELAAECFSWYNFTNNFSFTVLVGMLCFKYYQRAAPEYSEGVYYKGPKIYNGILNQIAFSIGLNMDVDLPDRRLVNLRKKVWCILVAMDVMESLTYGTPLSMNVNFSNVKLFKADEINESNSNYSNIEIEKGVVSHLNHGQPIIMDLMERLGTILHMRIKPKVKYMVEFTDNLERTAEEGFEIFNDLSKLQPADTWKLEILHKTYQLKNVLTTCMILLSMYQHLAMHWENKNNIGEMLKYRRKIYHLTITKLIPVLTPLIDDVENILGPSGILISCAFFMQVIYRACLMNIESYVRFMYHLQYFDDIYNGSSEGATISESLKKAIEILEKCIKFYIGMLSRLSKRGMPTERFEKLLKFYLKTVKEKELYSGSFCNKIIGEFKYSKKFLFDFISAGENALLATDYSELNIDLAEDLRTKMQNSETQFFDSVFKDFNFESLGYFDSFDSFGWPFNVTHPISTPNSYFPNP